MESALNYIAKAFILPPGCFFLALAAAFLFRRRLPRFALFIAVLSIVCMYLLSTAWFERLLVERIAVAGHYNYLEKKGKNPEIIVVLAGDRYREPPEYDGRDRVSFNTLSRLRYAVRLHRQTGLPFLVSGGWVMEKRMPLAELMKRCLTEYFCIDPADILLEGRSRNTHENARFTSKILDRHGMNTVLLVTDSLHMRRAAYEFRRAGIAVIPAPTHFISYGWQSRGLWGWLPRQRKVSYDALHELIGGLWYRIRYGKFSGNPGNTLNR